MRSPFTTCKGCGALIVWLRTKNDKACPVLRHRQDGTPIDSATEVFDPRVHHPHWADCPKAPRFKKPRPPAQARPQAPRPAPPIEDDDKMPGAYRRHRRAEEPPRPAPTILGLTLRPDLAWGIFSGVAEGLIPRRDYCLGRPGQYLAIHDGGAVIGVVRYRGRTEDGEAWIIGEERPFALPIPWPPGEGQWELPEALLVKVRAAYAERKPRPVEAKTSQPTFPWGDT